MPLLRDEIRLARPLLGGRAVNMMVNSRPIWTDSPTPPPTPEPEPSPNLLQYGALDIGGVTVTINSDGSMHVKGVMSADYNFLYWSTPLNGLMAGDLVSFTAGTLPVGMNVIMVARPMRGSSTQITTGTRIPDNPNDLQLRLIVRREVDVDIRPMLNRGTSVLDWAPPDVTNASGGGLNW